MKNLRSLLKPAAGKDRFFCPVCNNNNFTINRGTGAYSCWNGCSKNSLREAIRELSPEEPRAERTEKAPREHKKTEYIYTDRDGNPLIKVTKVVPGWNGADKSIFQEHWNGKEWRETYGPVKTPDIPLYRYVDVIAAIERGESIVLCEGESTAEAFWGKGIPATTTIGGTGKTVVKDKEGSVRRNKKTFESIKPALKDLANADVILAPDQDTPGCLHMEMMAELLPVKGWLYALPNSFQWQRLPKKGGIDFVDWLHDYPELTKEEILAEVVSEPTHGLPTSPQPQQESLSDTVVNREKRPAASRIAQLLHQAHPNLIYVADRKVWMMYETSTKGAWGEIPEELVEHLAMQLLERLGCGYLDNFTPISNTIKFLRTRTSAFVHEWEEADSSLLPFTNGVLDLKTGDFFDHDPKYHFTWTLPRPHDPAASQWDKIDAWLDFAAQGKTKLRTILECFAAAALKGRADLQKFLHLMGIGGSGKGTFMKLLTSLIGNNNVVTSNLKYFCSNPFEPSRLYGKRLVLFTDERGKPDDISEFMKLTGGGEIRCEKKWRDSFDFTFEGMTIIASEAPIFYGEMGKGLKRRTILLPMNAQVEDKDRRDLQVDFEPELAAFTNHLLALPDDFVSETLRNTEQTPDIKAYYWKARTREDSIAAWVDERLIYDPTAEISYTALYENYRDFCQQSGNQSKSKNKFSDQLPEVCELLQWEFSKHKTAYGRVVRGLKIRQPGDCSDYPSEMTYQAPPSDETKMTTLVTTCDDLSDDLKSDCIRKVTTMTTCSNLLIENKKSEEKKEEKTAESVKNNTLTPAKIPSDWDTFRPILSDEFLESTAKISRVAEKAFKARFSNPEEIEKHLQFLEAAEKIIRNNGYIYNAYRLIFKPGEEVTFTSKNGSKYHGEIEAMNFPSYTILSGGEREYIHCLNIKKKTAN